MTLLCLSALFHCVMLAYAEFVLLHLSHTASAVRQETVLGCATATNCAECVRIIDYCSVAILRCAIQ